jgi:hypothetical protein
MCTCCVHAVREVCFIYEYTACSVHHTRIGSSKSTVDVHNILPMRLVQTKISRHGAGTSVPSYHGMHCSLLSQYIFWNYHKTWKVHWIYTKIVKRDFLPLVPCSFQVLQHCLHVHVFDRPGKVTVFSLLFPSPQVLTVELSTMEIKYKVKTIFPSSYYNRLLY